MSIPILVCSYLHSDIHTCSRVYDAYVSRYSPWAIYDKTRDKVVLWWSASQAECCNAWFGVAESSDGVHFELVTMTGYANGSKSISIDGSALFIDDDGTGYGMPNTSRVCMYVRCVCVLCAVCVCVCVCGNNMCACNECAMALKLFCCFFYSKLFCVYFELHF